MLTASSLSGFNKNFATNFLFMWHFFGVFTFTFMCKLSSQIASIKLLNEKIFKKLFIRFKTQIKFIFIHFFPEKKSFEKEKHEHSCWNRTTPLNVDSHWYWVVTEKKSSFEKPYKSTFLLKKKRIIFFCVKIYCVFCSIICGK